MPAFDTVQTMTRRAFDPETISVTVGKINDFGQRFKVTVRDEISKLDSMFHINVEHSVEDLEGMIQQAAASLNLISGPRKIGDEIVEEGVHNHD